MSSPMSHEAERVVRSESGILDFGGRGRAVIFGAGNWGAPFFRLDEILNFYRLFE
jgi:hypothetical protein